MEVIYERCAGLDVHKKSVVACLRTVGRSGVVEQQIRTFGTMTDELEDLASWLSDAGVTHVAMESTGVFWKPLWNVLEGRFKVLLVNARHIKQVPGRKTDVKDCEWIAKLLQCGLLRGSFVPPERIRQLRDLTRHRAKLTDQRTSSVNRVHKVLEDANIKLGAVASDIMGVSGRAMLKAITEGENDPNVLSELAVRKLRHKIPELRRALHGKVSEHHRFLLGELLDQIEFLEGKIRRLDERIEEIARPFEASIQRLRTIVGVEQRSAENLLAEIGPDMGQFPSAAHLASWAAICPGNNESAGKRRSGRTSRGNRWLRRALTECAWAASRSKKSYLAAQYKRLAARRGKKRAIVAVGHTILTAAYHILADEQTTYRDLGPDHFDRLDPARLTRYLVRRLENLGHAVTLDSAA